MKYRSIIWTYILFSMLHLTGEESKTATGTEIFSEQELQQLAIDSVYNALSMSERLNLLSIHPCTSKNTSILSNDSIQINGLLYNPNDVILKPTSAHHFTEEEFHIATSTFTDSARVKNISIGQTGLPRLAFYGHAIQLQKLKKSGANIVLGQPFQTLISDWNNSMSAFQQSPLISEKYWEQCLMAGEQNGIKLGVSDFFFREKPVDPTKLSDFIAVGMSGNRYYARKGHGIIQLSDDIDVFQKRFSRFKSASQQSFLRTEMSFEGIIISQDFSELEKDEQITRSAKSLINGSDIVCVSFEFKNDLNSFLQEHFQKDSLDLKNRCIKILRLKHELHAIKENKTNFSQYDKPFEYQVKQASLTCIKTEGNILPIRNLSDTVTLFAQENNYELLQKEIAHYAPVKKYALEKGNLPRICVLDGFGENIDDAMRIATNYKGNTKFILLTDSRSFYRKRIANFNAFQGILLSSDTSALDISLCLQAAFGAHASGGHLPYYHTPRYPQGFGVGLRSLNRLSYIPAEYLGVNPEKINQIDNIAKEAIRARALPGCQIMVGYEGTVIYEKNFGHHDYSKSQPVENNTIYDIASISKIAASTVSLMSLQGENKFSLNDSLTNIIPEVVGNNPMKNIWLKDMMAHQAGLPAWIPFYLKTLSNKQPSPELYSHVKKDNFTVPVADNLWIRDDYPDTMYSRILSCNLKGRSYKYSDLGYYFVKKIIEKRGEKPMEQYVDEKVYQPLGLQTMTYNPYLKFPLNRIAPTENDKIFRKQTIHGYVHDPGSAMMGGVCGHAGVFSTANDLTILMQMLLNNGSYGGVQVLKEEIIGEYTSVQFPGRNRRGAGFDKPKLNGAAATACADASPSSFGHSGFTGTLTWADPKYNINYVFLSNRVNPSAENWKIVRMNIRTRIQTRIYQSIRGAKNYNFLASI